MQQFNQAVFNSVKVRVLEDIEKQKVLKSTCGFQNFGESYKTVEKLKIVESVLKGETPEFLRDAVSTYHKEQDAEYAEYLRLKAKFENK